MVAAEDAALAIKVGWGALVIVVRSAMAREAERPAAARPKRSVDMVRFGNGCCQYRTS